MTKVGRPPIFKTPKELEKAITDYFDQNPEKPTISGLAHHLGFTSRQSIYSYENEAYKLDNIEEYSRLISLAVLKIESLHEEGLYGNSNAGHIFWLKNRGWVDKQDIEHKGELKHSVIEWKPAQ